MYAQWAPFRYWKSKTRILSSTFTTVRSHIYYSEKWTFFAGRAPQFYFTFQNVPTFFAEVPLRKGTLVLLCDKEKEIFKFVFHSFMKTPTFTLRCDTREELVFWNHLFSYLNWALFKTFNRFFGPNPKKIQGEIENFQSSKSRQQSRSWWYSYDSQCLTRPRIQAQVSVQAF